MIGVAERLEHELGAGLVQREIGVRGARDGAERALDRNLAGSDVDVHALGQGNRKFCDARHGLPQATMQRTSPPTPSARALRSVITPREVERIATPRPFSTRGMSSRPL